MRADRLLSIMLLLHARGRLTVQELAAQLEVSQRTIYRDVEALSIAGIPVYTQPGVNGGVFLDDHYRLALTGLSTPEVQALFLSTAGGPLGDLGLSGAVRGTLLKLFAALPTAQRSAVEQFRQRFYIDPSNWFQVVEPSPFFALLQQAVWDERLLHVRYQPVEGRQTSQVVEPYGLVAKANIWYLVGKKQHGDMRNYRIGRLQEVDLLDAVFERDPAFDLGAYWRESCAQYEREGLAQNPPYHTVLRVHHDAFWYFPAYMEGYYRQLAPPDADGWLMLEVSFASLSEARMRVLGLGAKIRVLQPRELYDTVIATARAVLALDAEG